MFSIWKARLTNSLGLILYLPNFCVCLPGIENTKEDVKKLKDVSIDRGKNLSTDIHFLLTCVHIFRNHAYWTYSWFCILFALKYSIVSILISLFFWICIIWNAYLILHWPVIALQHSELIKIAVFIKYVKEWERKYFIWNFRLSCFHQLHNLQCPVIVEISVIFRLLIKYLLVCRNFVPLNWTSMI